MASQKLKRAKGPRHQVLDAGPLSGVVDGIIRTRHDNSTSAAASASRIPYNTLKRIRLGALKEIRQETLDRLMQWLGTKAARGVQAAFVSPEAAARMRRFDEWATVSSAAITFGAEALNLHGLDKLELAELADPRALFGRNPRLAQQVAAAQLHSRAREVLQGLRVSFRSYWAELEKLLSSGKFSRARAELARNRVATPFLDWQYSASIERRAFSRLEAQCLIKAGVTRECILLHRESDVRRAAELGRAKARRSSLQNGRRR